MENIFSSVLVPLFDTSSLLFYIFIACCFLFLLIKYSLTGFFKGNLSYRYILQENLFTPAERSFLGVLNQAVSNDYQIFGKVRIADVLKPLREQDRKTSCIAFNRISSKHFDFVLCDKDTLSVVAVVELDDKSHNSKTVKSRDLLVENACGSAGLTLIRFACKSKYSIQDVRTKVSLSIS